MSTWFLAFLSRDYLTRQAARLARRFRDLLSASEIESAVHLGISQAVLKFDPKLGRFRDFARPFVERVLRRIIAREVSWRKELAASQHEVDIVVEHAGDFDAWRNELRQLLGTDYDTFVKHFAFGWTMRELCRGEARSFREIRCALERARGLIYDAYGYLIPSTRPTRPLDLTDARVAERSRAEPARGERHARANHRSRQHRRDSSGGAPNRDGRARIGEPGEPPEGREVPRSRRTRGAPKSEG